MQTNEFVLREGVKKNYKLWTSLRNKKDTKCSETEKYAKIFCAIFARLSFKNLDIFPDIFMKY